MLHYQKIEIPLSLKVILAASRQWCRERMLKDVFPECGVFCPDPSKAWSAPIFLFLSANWCTNVVGFFFWKLNRRHRAVSWRGLYSLVNCLEKFSWSLPCVLSSRFQKEAGTECLQGIYGPESQTVDSATTTPSVTGDTAHTGHPGTTF